MVGGILAGYVGLGGVGLTTAFPVKAFDEGSWDGYASLGGVKRESGTGSLRLLLRLRSLIKRIRMGFFGSVSIESR